MIDSFDYSTGCGHKCATLVELLRYRALHQPDRRAYTFLLDGETQTNHLSYQQLDQLARAIAAQLQIMGATGERALLLYPPGLDFIAAFFGCLYAGVVAVPAYPPKANQKMSRLQVIVEDSQARFALTTTSLLASIERQFGQNSTSSAIRWLATDSVASTLASEWQELTYEGSTLAFLQYTSGSTATPKGVMIAHGNLMHNSALINQCFEDTPSSLGVSWLPPYHDMGLIGGVIQPLYVGAPMILMSPVDFLQRPLRWLEAISRYRVTTSGGPNFAYDLCVRKITPKQREHLDLSSWEFAFTGAEPVRAETIERFAATFQPCGFRWDAFSPCYGMAETTLFVSGVRKTTPPVVQNVETVALEHNQVVVAQGEGTRKLVGCGQTWEEKIVIVNPDSLTRCATEQVGEIWVSGLSVAQGYWNRPDQTEQTFKAYLTDPVEGPFLRTGDLGFLQAGQLFITGRLKDLIIIRGRNHYPQDIELTVEHSHPALRPACGAAFSIDVEGSERLVVVQEIERSYLRKLDVDEVVESIRRVVSQEYELQVNAVLLLKTGSIPKTSSGKIQRHACRVGFLENSLNVVGSWKSSKMASVEQQNGYPARSNSQLSEAVSGDAEGLLAQSEQTLVNEDKARKHLQHQNGSATRSDLKTNVSETTPKASEELSPHLPVNPQTAESIQNWMVDWLIRELDVEPQSINISKSFADYGLDSMVAMELADALQNWLGVTLSPTLAYEYPTIEFLAQHLATLAGESEKIPEVMTYQFSGNEEVDQLLAELEGLSEAEVQKALGK